MGRRLLIPGDGEVQRAGGGNPVEVEAVEPKGARGEHAARFGFVGRVAGGQPQLCCRPRDIVGEVVVAVGAAAVGALVVGRDQSRSGSCGPVGHDRGVEQPPCIGRISAQHSRSLSRGGGQMQGGAGRRAMEHAGGGIQVWPARQWRPLRAVHSMKGESREREARRHLHAQEPVELPATFLREQRLGPLPPLRLGAASAQQIQGGQQLPDCERAAGHVLAVVAGVVPAPGHVEATRTRPARIHPFGVLAGPRRHRSIARVAGRTAVARCPHLVDRRPTALEVEERQRVTRQWPVQLRRYRERVARVHRRRPR